MNSRITLPDMPESKPVQFSFAAGPAGELRVTASNGKVYRLLVGTTIFSVTENGLLNADGTPQFEVRAGIQFDKTQEETP